LLAPVIFCHGDNHPHHVMLRDSASRARRFGSDERRKIIAEHRGGLSGDQ
jgi:hypothetical protein